MGSDGDDRLGGADFDVLVAHLLAQQHSSVLENFATYGDHDSIINNNKVEDMAESLASSCSRITDDIPLCSVSSFHTLGEKVKISLSQQQYQQQETNGQIQEYSIIARSKCLALPPFTAEVKSSSLESLCESLYVETLEVSLEEYNKACQPLFDRSVVPATRLIEDLTLQIEEIDEIVMVGGTTRMPQIRELVRQAFPKAQLNTHIDPDVTVVRSKYRVDFSIPIYYCIVHHFVGVMLMTTFLDAWLLTRGFGGRSSYRVHLLFSLDASRQYISKA